jgi:hypothetical protein
MPGAVRAFSKKSWEDERWGATCRRLMQRRLAMDRDDDVDDLADVFLYSVPPEPEEAEEQDVEENESNVYSLRAHRVRKIMRELKLRKSEADRRNAIAERIERLQHSTRAMDRLMADLLRDKERKRYQQRKERDE